MTDKELEEFIYVGENNFIELAMIFGSGWASTALQIATEHRAMLAQPEETVNGWPLFSGIPQPEPVLVSPKEFIAAVTGKWDITGIPMVMSVWPEPLYTLEQVKDAAQKLADCALMTPPKKEWVGLTDEERYCNDGRSEQEIEYAKAIEAKLKEKNNGNG